MEVKGKVHQILKLESGTSKAGKEWRKQSFVIDTGDQYNPLVCISAFGDDKIQVVEGLKVGEGVTVHFNLSSKEFNGKYYHSVDMWKIDKGIATSVAEPVEDGDDEMPF